MRGASDFAIIRGVAGLTWGSEMPASDESAAGALVARIGPLSRRRRARGLVARYLVAAVFVGAVAVGLYWLVSQPLTGKGTVSASQYAAQAPLAPGQIHGFRRLKPDEHPDANMIAP